MCRVFYSTPNDRPVMCRCLGSPLINVPTSPLPGQHVAITKAPKEQLVQSAKPSSSIYIFSQKVCIIINFICFTSVSENKQDGFAEAFFLFMPRSQCAVNFKP